MTRYFDASALVKLVLTEAESEPLAAHIVSFPDSASTSLVAITEVGIAAARAGVPAYGLVTARQGWVTTEGLSILGMPPTPRTVQAAAHLGAQLGLRALDAIHVATAVTLRESLSEVITYDARMIAACRALGLPVTSPA